MPQPKPLEVVPEIASTAQNQANPHEASGPLTSSWGSSLQNLRHEPKAARASSQRPVPTEITGSVQTVGSVPRQIREKEGSQPTGRAKPSVERDQASAPTNDGPERVSWVRMTTAVKTRSAAAVEFADATILLRRFNSPGCRTRGEWVGPITGSDNPGARLGLPSLSRCSRSPHCSTARGGQKASAGRRGIDKTTETDITTADPHRETHDPHFRPRQSLQGEAAA